MRRSLGFGVAFGVVVAIGCGQVINGGSNGSDGATAQGEGGRCTFVPNEKSNNALNGTDECQAGLLCYPGQQFADYSQGVTFDRCCPPVLSPTDPVAACRNSGSVTGGNPTAGADASFDAQRADVRERSPSDGSQADGESGSVDLDVTSPPIDVTLPPLDAALASLDAAPPGLAAFAFIVNDVVQHPLACAGVNWEFPPYPGTSSGGCADSCSGVGGWGPVEAGSCGLESVLLVNTGALDMAYIAAPCWDVPAHTQYAPGGYPGGDFLAGVLAPGTYVDIMSVYNSGITALVGSAAPFSSADSSYANDEGQIPWPSGVNGSGGATTMYVAEIEVRTTCQAVTSVW